MVAARTAKASGAVVDQQITTGRGGDTAAAAGGDVAQGIEDQGLAAADRQGAAAQGDGVAVNREGIGAGGGTGGQGAAAGGHGHLTAHAAGGARATDHHTRKAAADVGQLGRGEVKHSGGGVVGAIERRTAARDHALAQAHGGAIAVGDEGQGIAVVVGLGANQTLDVDLIGTDHLGAAKAGGAAQADQIGGGQRSADAGETALAHGGIADQQAGQGPLGADGAVEADRATAGAQGQVAGAGGIGFDHRAQTQHLIGSSGAAAGVDDGVAAQGDGRVAITQSGGTGAADRARQGHGRGGRGREAAKAKAVAGAVAQGEAAAVGKQGLAGNGVAGAGQGQVVGAAGQAQAGAEAGVTRQGDCAAGHHVLQRELTERNGSANGGVAAVDQGEAGQIGANAAAHVDGTGGVEAHRRAAAAGRTGEAGDGDGAAAATADAERGAIGQHCGPQVDAGGVGGAGVNAGCTGNVERTQGDGVVEAGQLTLQRTGAGGMGDTTAEVEHVTIAIAKADPAGGGEGGGIADISQRAKQFEVVGAAVAEADGIKRVAETHAATGRLQADPVDAISRAAQGAIEPGGTTGEHGQLTDVGAHRTADTHVAEGVEGEVGGCAAVGAGDGASGDAAGGAAANGEIGASGGGQIGQGDGARGGAAKGTGGGKGDRPRAAEVEHTGARSPEAAGQGFAGRAGGGETATKVKGIS